MPYRTQTVRALLFLTLPLFFVGCGGKGPKDGAAGKGGKPAEEHHHHHHGSESGPHKGMLVELGEEEYHAEVAHDDAAHSVTIYILDAKPEKNVPIDQKEIVLKLKDGDAVSSFTLPAKPLDDEKGGKSSRFELVDEKLAELMEKKGVAGNFNVLIGKPFIGSFTVEEHDHDHDKDAKEKK